MHSVFNIAASWLIASTLVLALDSAKSSKVNYTVLGSHLAANTATVSVAM